MKLLVVASSIYDKDLFAKRRAITGLEIMVRDILDGVSDQIECSMYATHLKNKGAQLGRIKLLSNSNASFLKAVKSVGLEGYKSVFGECAGRPFFERIDLAKATILLEYYINEIAPDIVNFHDLNDWNTFLIKRLEKKGIKILLTDHLYIGTKKRTYGYANLRNNEEKVFKNAPRNLYVSFVSTGMRERFLSDYTDFPSENAFCVVNGTKVTGKDISSLEKPAIFEKLKGKKVLLCIGGFNARKNQQMIIDAFIDMPPKQKDKVAIVFIGVGKKVKLRYEHGVTGSSNSLYYIDFVSPSEMASFYGYCDGTITASLNESFGLTIIEGFCYGKPAILFNDIDSFSDLYDEKVCVPIKEHTVECIRTAINDMVAKEWNSKYIKNHINKFTLERVQREYCGMYRRIVDYAK